MRDMSGFLSGFFIGGGGGGGGGQKDYLNIIGGQSTKGVWGHAP